MSDKPGWGHPHVHAFLPTGRWIGALAIERCACGRVRHVIKRREPPPCPMRGCELDHDQENPQSP